MKGWQGREATRIVVRSGSWDSDGAVEHSGCDDPVVPQHHARKRLQRHIREHLRGQGNKRGEGKKEKNLLRTIEGQVQIANCVLL